MPKNNTSGTVGVYYDQHSASWTVMRKDEEGNNHTKSYSVNNYGFENAKDLAIQYRGRIERELPHYANALQLNVDNQ